ncbi:MAG: ribosome small subunit-dependent GTPase A [Lachnospiraceae bacterium]|nr:ribosome small subunit-dependent GTPase A [Lachnospiraceae bacterium]
MQGKIIRGVGGFYYVNTDDDGIFECRARGIFRKLGKKPLVGDDVIFEITSLTDREGSITELLPRKNELFRPAAANVDQALVVFALHSPEPSLMLLDRFLIAMDRQNVPSAILFNKADLEEAGEQAELLNTYQHSGHKLFFSCVEEGKGLRELAAFFDRKTTLLAGPSGVGKSSLINASQSKVRMETGEISRKLLRGKNTTRHAELISCGGGTYLMDTPGFTLLETRGIEKEELRRYYAEFASWEGKCRFDSCVHIDEPGCRVKEAVEAGRISRTRYANYRGIFRELKEQEKHRY